ncbi:unnamed protein product, partial [Durusdinium trenchii]
MDHSLRTTQTTGEGRRPLHPSLLILIHPFSTRSRGLLGDFSGAQCLGRTMPLVAFCCSE